MEEKQILETGTIVNNDLPVLSLHQIDDELLRRIYYFAKYLSFIAGNKAKYPQGDYLRNIAEYSLKIKNTRQRYERISPVLKTTIVGLENLKLLKNEIPPMFKIGFAELDSEPFKVNKIDAVLRKLEVEGKIKGVADMYLNYAISFAISAMYFGKRSSVEDLLDLSLRYQKRDGDKRQVYFSFRSNSDHEHEWMPRSTDFPFYISTKVAVWLP